MIDKKIKATDYYDVIGDSNVYGIWENEKITARLYPLTQDFSANVPKWANDS